MVQQSDQPNAYDLYLRGVAHANEYTEEDNKEADRPLRQALQ